MADIFISYAKKDRKRVEPLAKTIEMQGWTVWWDPIIPTGKDFDEVIEEELSIARCVIVIWTKRSVKSKYVKGEARDALNRDILVPVEIESGIKPPFDFRSIQTLSLINWDGSDKFPEFQKLIDDVTSIIGKPPVKEQAEREAAEAKQKAEEEQKRNEVKKEIKLDTPEPVKAKPPEPKLDANATTEPRPPEPSKKSNAVKFSAVAGLFVLLFVLLIVEIWLYLSKPTSPSKILKNRNAAKQYLIGGDKPLRAGPVYFDRLGEVSMVVELPPGFTPESSYFSLRVDDKTVATGVELKTFRQLGKGLALVVCVDVSGTMRGNTLFDTREALLSFVGEVRREDRIALISFADHSKSESLFGDSRQDLVKAIQGLKNRGSSTRLYQTLYDSLDTFEGAKIPKRRRVIVISDGKDEGSMVTAQNVITKSKASQIPIDAVGQGKIDDQYAEGLRGLATITGGRFVHARPARLSLSDAISRIYRDLLETRSLVITFKYDMEDAGQTTPNAVIEFQLPGQAPYSVQILEEIPIPKPPRSFIWLHLLVVMVLVLCIGLYIWIRHRFKEDEKLPRGN